MTFFWTFCVWILHREICPFFFYPINLSLSGFAVGAQESSLLDFFLFAQLYYLCIDKFAFYIYIYIIYLIKCAGSQQDKSNIHSCSILGQSTSHQNTRKKADSQFYTQYNHHDCFNTTQTQTVTKMVRIQAMKKTKLMAGIMVMGKGGGLKKGKKERGGREKDKGGMSKWEWEQEQKGWNSELGMFYCRKAIWPITNGMTVNIQRPPIQNS